MKYCKINNGIYNVHFITTNKFKTTTISINFRKKIKKEDITIRKFLFQMLTSTTLKYNTPRLFEIKLEDLYSLSLSHSNIKFGNYINNVFIELYPLIFLLSEMSKEERCGKSFNALTFFTFVFSKFIYDMSLSLESSDISETSVFDKST